MGNINVVESPVNRAVDLQTIDRDDSMTMCIIWRCESGQYIEVLLPF